MKLIGAGLRVRPFFCLFFSMRLSPHQLLIGRRALPLHAPGKNMFQASALRALLRTATRLAGLPMPTPPVTYRASSLEATLQRSIAGVIGKTASISGKNGREIKFRFPALVSCSTGTSFLVNNETRVSIFSFMSSPPNHVFWASNQLLIGRRASLLISKQFLNKRCNVKKGKCYFSAVTFGFFWAICCLVTY
jgi:hypothetical protein